MLTQAAVVKLASLYGSPLDSTAHAIRASLLEVAVTLRGALFSNWFSQSPNGARFSLHPYDCGPSAMDEQLAKVRVAALADAKQPCLAAGSSAVSEQARRRQQIPGPCERQHRCRSLRRSPWPQVLS